jgi:hypothetical protein
MKKHLLVIIALVCFSFTGFSQLSIQDTSGATVPNGDTLVVNGTVGYQMSGQFFIYNSIIPISVEAICIPGNVAVSGCTYSICVGATCYKTVADNTGFTSPAFTTPSGKNTNAFFTDYNPISAGTTIIMYEIKNKTGTDSTWFYVKFIATPVGIATITDATIKVGALYPNPANSQVGFTYHSDSPAQLSIYNSLGQLVKLLPLPANKEHMDINTTDMASGIYICKVQIAGGESTFRRLVVSH